MMRRMFPVALAIAAMFIPDRDALPQPAPHSTFVRVFAAIASQPMDDLDGYVADNLNALAGVPGGKISEFGSTGLLGGEVGYMLNRLWSVSISASYSSASESAIFGSFFFDFGTNTLNASMTDLTANATVWAPGSGGLFAGAEAGVGFGKLTETFGYSDDSGNVLNYRGDWEGTGFVGGAFAGYQHAFRVGLLAVARAGFKYRSLGRMDGKTTITESTFSSFPPGVTPGPITDSTGRELESDFSCLYFGLGLGWSFGGTR